MQTPEPPNEVPHFAELRALAIVCDETSRETVLLSDVWVKLTTGHERAVAAFLTGERCYLLTEERTPARALLSARQLDVLGRVLIGSPQKSIAADYKRSISTIAMISRTGLMSLGLNCTPSKAPLLLVLAAHAAHGSGQVALARVSALAWAGRRCRVFSSERPDGLLEQILTPAEYSVVRLLIEGKTHAEIARERRRSTRTIANQLASAFSSLRHSGRSQLMQFLAGPSSRPPVYGRALR